MNRLPHDIPQMSGTLFVVATPIGNLEDITLRALRVLREAKLIAAEDTRRTARLLSHHGISTPTLSFHAHNTGSRIPLVIDRLRSGGNVAVVTDAGMPGISDPGVELVRACVDAGIPVDPIPGASAPLTAAIASGFPLDPLTIFGFPPTRAKDRSRWFEALADVPHTATFFEAPHRIAVTLSSLADKLGDRPICVGRELTKLHQEFLRGTPTEVIAHPFTPKGEFTIVVGPAVNVMNDKGLEFSDDRAAHEFGVLTEFQGFGRRAAIAELAKKFGRSTRDVYAAVERAKSGAPRS